MNVDTKMINPALESLIKDPNQDIFLDTNIFIPPDRTKLGVGVSVSFIKYKETFLDPLFDCFSKLSIHESVKDELVEETVKGYAMQQIVSNPNKLSVYENSTLSVSEKIVYDTYVNKLAVHSKYMPNQNNADDKGEILSLAYMATKNFMYFAANDNLAIRLVKNADQLNTGLGHMSVIQTYEILYYFYRMKIGETKSLRAMYKYLYKLTKREKDENPDWGDFIQQMDQLYG